MELEFFSFCHLEIRLDFQPHPTEPALYRGSYTTGSKEIVDTEITLHRNAGIVIEHTITILPEIRVASMMKVLLKLTVCEQGGLRN